MKSPIRADYRISKKNRKPVFDLKDMLMIVESLEEEALSNEHQGNLAECTHTVTRFLALALYLSSWG